VAYEALESLVKQEFPEASYVGIGLAVLSVIVMPLLARAKRTGESTVKKRQDPSFYQYWHRRPTIWAERLVDSLIRPARCVLIKAANPVKEQ